MNRLFSLSLFIILWSIPFFWGCTQEKISDISDPDLQTIQNFEAFTRLYGYVKFFYPGDEVANIDMERFAAFGMKAVEKARNSKELKNTLETLFLPIAPALMIHESDQKLKFSLDRITPPDPKNMKDIHWQHYGVGFGDVESFFKSIRVNRENLAYKKKSFGTLSSWFDATSYQKKKIKLKAAVKVTKGKAQLWLQENRKSGQMGFFDDMRDRPITSDQWQYYEIIGDIAEDANQITIGCVFRSNCQIELDDFQLYVRDNDNTSWQAIEIKNPGFEADTLGGPPKDWQTRSRDYRIKVTSDDNANGKKHLSIKSVDYTLPSPLPNFQENPQFGEFIDKEIGSDLSVLMPLVLKGTNDFTYPSSDRIELEKVKKALKNELPKRLTADNLYVRLANIAITWNVFQHFYPYFDVVKIDWNKTLKNAFQDTYKDKTPNDFLKSLRKFSSHINDGHLKITLEGDYSEDFVAPITWNWIEDKLVITNLFEKKFSHIKVGDIVEEINGVEAKVAVEKQKQYVSAATEGWRLYRALNDLLLGTNGKKLNLKINRNGKIHQLEIFCVMPVPFYNKLLDRGGITSKKIEEGIYYLNLKKINMTEIQKLMPELEKSKSIICDLRGIPNNNHHFLSHLLKEKDSATWMFFPKIIYPDFQQVTFQGYGWKLSPQTPHLKAKFIFIVNPRSISYSESFLGFIEAHKLAVIVGQPTAGTNGEINSFELPGGYKISWTGMKVVKHNGSQHHGIGIVPDFFARKTIKGVKEGTDEFLEKAVEIAKNSK